MPIARPKNYHIRKLGEGQRNGQVFNPPQDLIGWGNQSYPKDSTFEVEAPMKGSTPAEKGGKAPY